MSRFRSGLPYATVFFLGCCVTFVLMSGYHLLQDIRAWDTPLIREDIGDYWFKQAGLEFTRPDAATNACVAFVGHGMGDTSCYLSFDIPKDALADFLAGQPSCKVIPKDELQGRFSYRDSLPPAAAKLIMPKPLPDSAEAYSLGTVDAVYDTAEERLHLHNCCP